MSERVVGRVTCGRARSGMRAAGAIRLAGLLGAALLVAGCPVPELPGDGEPEKKDTPPQEPPPSVAGTWTREGETPVRFTVTDDGTRVHGVRDASPDFASYTFDLERRGGPRRLAGRATFAFADAPARTYDTTWEVELGGDQKLRGRVEWLDVEADGAVSARGMSEATFAFEPLPPPPPETGPPPPPAFDMSAMVPVAASYKHLLYDGIAVGQYADVQTDVMGQVSLARTSVVGETPEAWIVEMDNQMAQRDLILAVFVDKTTGAPRRAYVGNRGQDGREKECPAPPADAPPGAGPQGTEERVTVAAGEFDAVAVEQNGVTTWTGRGGDIDGVWLKTASAASNDELTVFEPEASLEVAGRTWTCRHLAYQSGLETWTAPPGRVYFNAMLKMQMRSPQMTTVLAATGTDAAAAFNYPR